MKRILFISLTVLLLLILGVGAYAYYQYQQFLQQPLTLSEHNTTFTVASGSNIRQIARRLNEQAYLPQTQYLSADLLMVAYARLSGQASQIKAGEYELNPGMTVPQVLERFVSGKTLQYAVRLIEGRNYKQMVQTVQSQALLEHVLSDNDYNDYQQIMTRLGSDEFDHPEGWFMPDTYYFPRGTTDEEVLKRAYKAMRDYLLQAWEKRDPNPHIRTPYEALILASIIEKESGVAEERPIIARVFLNRLEKGMKLQTDPTVIYGMGKAYQGNIRKRDLKTDTPYNTYTRFGLPPTPIAMPGREAIEAALHPAESDYLYFVATGEGDGRHYFSKTYQEHRKAVIQYQLNGNSRRYKGDH